MWFWLLTSAFNNWKNRVYVPQCPWISLKWIQESEKQGGEEVSCQSRQFKIDSPCIPSSLKSFRIKQDVVHSLSYHQCFEQRWILHPPDLYTGKYRSEHNTKFVTRERKIWVDQAHLQLQSIFLFKLSWSSNSPGTHGNFYFSPAN